MIVYEQYMTDLSMREYYLALKVGGFIVNGIVPQQGGQDLYDTLVFSFYLKYTLLMQS